MGPSVSQPCDETRPERFDMNVLIPLVVGLGLLALGAWLYPRYLCRKLGVDDANPTPAHRLRDGRDYVPSSPHIVFAHHFSTIAGAGPIVGPTLALAFGWAPAWAWIILGCILFGAVHDMTAMFVSMREDGRSIAEMSRRTLGPAGYFLFLAFLILILTLINAIFLNLSCKALTAAYPAAMLKLAPGSHLLGTFVQNGVPMARIGGIATTSVLIMTLCAPPLGWLAYRRRVATGWLYLVAGAIALISVIVGFFLPVVLTVETWRYVMSAYVFLACWLPICLVIQPRDFANVQVLYLGVFLMIVGLVGYGVTGHTLGADLAAVSEGARLSGGPLWPFLMITVACGAISGFHSLAASGTTVKQIRRESEVRRVGYNAMILEGALALLSLLLLATALPRAEYLSIVYPAGGDGNPILAFSVAFGYMLHELTPLPIAIGCVIGILVLEGFVITTLDTAVRLCRYMLEEFWTVIFAGRPVPLLRNPFLNTVLAVGLMLFFALNSTIMSAWKVFGAGNQLIAALAMTVVSVWLLLRGRSFWFTILPAMAMTLTTFAALIISLRHLLAPAGEAGLFKAGQWPLATASLLLLGLAACVLVVAVRRFWQLRGSLGLARRAPDAA